MPLLVGPSMVSEVVRSIIDGAIVLVPTDTVYGLAVHPERSDSVSRVFEIKGRPLQKNLPVMVSDPSEIAKLGVDVNGPARQLLESGLVPGPITLVLGFDPNVARPSWLEGRVEVAVRIPNHDLFREVLRGTGPLLVTSANASGEPTPENVDAIAGSLLGPPDYVIDGGTLSAKPSTLVNVRASPPRVERVGDISIETVEEILRGTRTDSRH